MKVRNQRRTSASIEAPLYLASAIPAGVLVLALFTACARAPLPAPAGVPPPPNERTISPPVVESPRLSAAGLTHLLRGLYFVAGNHPSAAIPHLRLALVYDEESAFVYERLSMAWGSAGEEAAAIATLAAGLRRAPEDPDLNFLAGQLQIRERDHAAAAQHLRVALRSERTLPRAGPLLVDALLWLGRREEAVSTAHQLLVGQPGEPGLALALAAVLEDHGQLQQSLETYRDARQQRPADRAAANGEVRVLDLLGRTHEAADCLVSLFAFYPDAPDLYVELTRLLRRLGSSDAVAYRAEALRQTEGESQGRLLVAVGDLVAGHVEEATMILAELIAQAPDFHPARTLLAEVRGGDQDAAGCLQALAVEPGAPDPFGRTRAWCHTIGGRPEAVVDELRQAVGNGEAAGDVLAEGARLLAARFPPTTTRKYFEILKNELRAGLSPRDLNFAEALLADADEDGDDAIARIRAELVRQPEEPRLRLRLADLEVRYGDPGAGIQILEDLLAQDPGDVIRLNALGFTLADIGTRLEDAAVWLRRAYRMASEDGFVIDSLGWLLHRQGRNTEALRLLERAARVTVNDPEILRHLGDGYRGLERPADARVAYERALAAFPNPALRRLLEERLAEYGAGQGAS